MHINRLILYTSNLEEQILFYRDTLGLRLINQNHLAVEFIVGKTTLCFRYKQGATPYHFAVNIPGNKETEALEWLKERVAILKDNGAEIIDFKKWNAKAIYFYDADKNIVEFIARKNLGINRDEPFDQSQLIGMSEIGMPVDDIARVFNKINALQRTPLYDGDFTRFCAAGDESGLFIIINKHLKKWAPVDDPAYSSDFILEGDHYFEFTSGEITGK